MSTPQKKFFYGWYVILAAALGLLLGFAPIFVYYFGVFIKPLTAEFHSTRTSISSVASPRKKPRSPVLSWA